MYYDCLINGKPKLFSLNKNNKTLTFTLLSKNVKPVDDYSCYRILLVLIQAFKTTTNNEIW